MEFVEGKEGGREEIKKEMKRVEFVYRVLESNVEEDKDGRQLSLGIGNAAAAAAAKSLQ